MFRGSLSPGMGFGGLYDKLFSAGRGIFSDVRGSLGSWKRGCLDVHRTLSPGVGSFEDVRKTPSEYFMELLTLGKFLLIRELLETYSKLSICLDRGGGG